MSSINLVLSYRVKKDYKELPPTVQKKFKKQLRFMAENPRHPSLQIHRIRGTEYWEFSSSNKICGFAISEAILAKPNQESSQYASKKV